MEPPIDSEPAPTAVAAADVHAAALAKAQSRVAAGASPPPAPAVRSDNSGEDLTDILAEECAALAARDAAVAAHGLDSVPALQACVRVLDSWIGLYKLAPMDKLLDEILPLCRKRYAPPSQHYKQVIAAISAKNDEVDAAKSGGAAAEGTATPPAAAAAAAAAADSKKDASDASAATEEDANGDKQEQEEQEGEEEEAPATSDPSDPRFGLTAAFVADVGEDLELVPASTRARARARALKKKGLPLTTPIARPATTTAAASDAAASDAATATSDAAASDASSRSPSEKLLAAIESATAAGTLSPLLPASFDSLSPQAVEAALAAADALDARDAAARRLAGADLYLRALQLQAFLRYKQFRFRESLVLFRRFRALAGPSPELLENMGHAHNAVGEHAEAVNCFLDALAAVKLRGELNKEYHAEEHMGGLLLGLGVSYKRLGRLADGLASMQEALAVYKKRFGGADHSLIAKTLSGIADVHESLQQADAAMAAREEAVRIFKATCGVSPLTANALDRLGRARVAQGDVLRGLAALDEALFLHLGFDTIDLGEVATLLMLLLEVRAQLVGKPFPTPQSPALTAARAFEGYVKPLRAGLAAMEEPGRAGSEDAAVVYKSSGEIFLVAGEKEDAKKALLKSLALLVQVKGVDVSGLVKTVIALIEYCG